MSPSLSRCAHCGATLPAPDAVCPQCDLVLSREAGSPTHGRYRCPACDGRFDQPAQGWWPPNVPWYRPQDAKPQCPHCQAWLQDRTEPAISRTEWWGIGALALALGMALSWLLSRASVAREWRQPITLAVLYGLFWWWQSRRRRQARASISVEEARYALEARPR